ncbi:FHA domain-containing protein [Leptospira sp. 2 VSF19]|uniref:FHA domain-containing protein n=1 Tax=Leptospira soteropolitanensis TaxID=2950025 RepID=A0AAW5VBV5_9LEPT|nr:FHA domain-containing protein [Leptospira soteropolitanensis]MCW7492259.1 FHA domain-containing protein [Leptospira soteropolitanensis]MCW7499841.1 FHA domain-containing protein [Leptospira soteropolitanensis]MCW7522092.1 FHA domain-containing protein [Leptospira soteropolitanensis]MCW7525946.1 FHA domain-containing protein [Leptospira soteropolitanensis]MCW7529940.1 FHA domain-containing protein [Leptospira soteropolitanensis]
MENNLRKPLYFFSNWTLLFLVLIPAVLSANPNLNLRSVDTGSYPEVKIRFHSNRSFDPQGLVISEQLGSNSRLTDSFRLQKTEAKNPVHLYISIPSYSNAEDRRWLVQLANQLVKVSEQSGGTSKLQIQADENKHSIERIRSSVLDVSFPFPKVPPPNYPIRNWENFLTGIKKNQTTEDNILVFVSFSPEWQDRFEIPELAKRIREKNLQLIVLAPSSLEATKLASYANGRHYPISKPDSYSELFSYLRALGEEDYELIYLSPWKLSRWKTNILSGGFAFGDQGSHLEFQYELSFLKSLYLLISDPMFFFPVSFFLIFLCLAALYYLRGYEEPNSSLAKVINIESDFSERKEELQVYDRMYGETLEKAAKDREIAVAIAEKESLPGVSYSYAVLMRKDSNHNPIQYALQFDEVTIGSWESNHLVLDDPNVAGIHAKIKNKKGKYILFDCVSESGVYLNGKKLLRPKVLHNLDEIQIGKTILSFRGR